MIMGDFNAKLGCEAGLLSSRYARLAATVLVQE